MKCNKLYSLNCHWKCLLWNGLNELNSMASQPDTSLIAVKYAYMTVTWTQWIPIEIHEFNWFLITVATLIARFMGPTSVPPGAHRTQVGPRWATWTLLSGYWLTGPRMQMTIPYYVRINEWKDDTFTIISCPLFVRFLWDIIVYLLLIQLLQILPYGRHGLTYVTLSMLWLLMSLQSRNQGISSHNIDIIC